MKFVKLTTGNVAEATVVPISEWIDKANNRSFAGEGYIQITESIEDTEVLTGLYNSSAEADGIKTVSSFTLPTTDSNGNNQTLIGILAKTLDTRPKETYFTFIRNP